MNDMTVIQGSNGSNPDWAKELWSRTQSIKQSEPDKYDSVSEYQMFGFHKLNKGLRKGDLVSLGSQLTKDIDYLFRNYATSFPSETLLYRAIELPYSAAMDSNPADYAAEMFRPGEVLTDNAFVSTSADSDFMLNFGRPKYDERPVVVLQIEANQGLPVLCDGNSDKAYLAGGDSVQSFEREVLLDRGSRFLIGESCQALFRHSYGDKGWHKSFHFPREKEFTLVRLVQME